jgi:hypothetical protein
LKGAILTAPYLFLYSMKDKKDSYAKRIEYLIKKYSDKEIDSNKELEMTSFKPFYQELELEQ